MTGLKVSDFAWREHLSAAKKKTKQVPQRNNGHHIMTAQASSVH